MFRYLRLYFYFLRFSFSRAMEFRVDFFFRVVMDTIWYVTQIAFFFVLFRHTPLIGGWDIDKMLIFVSAYLVIDAVHMTVFINNTMSLPLFVNRGDLDYYLTRPVSSLFFLSLRDFAANSFLNLVIALGIMAWALARFPAPLDAGRVALFVALVLAGGALLFFIQMIFLIPVFWFHSDKGLNEVFRGFSNFAHRPDQIFTGWVRRALITIVPVALIASFPSHILFDGATPGLLLHIAVVYAVAFGAMVAFWRLALRSYSSASS